MSNLEIRFYDNEETNWENDMKIFDDQVDFIHVDEYVPNKLISHIVAPDIDPNNKLQSISERNAKYIRGYIEVFAKQNNSYALYLQECIQNSEADKNEILKQVAWEGVLRLGYPNNGLLIDDLLVWCSQNSSNKIILSDWDRTITVCEGMQFGSNQDGILTNKVESGEILMEDLLVYIMGGSDRLTIVKDMLKQIHDLQVPLYILTHNRNASKNMWPKNRRLYILILQELMPYKSVSDIESMLFSSADYISMKSIKMGDSEGSYRKYKSSCSIKLLKDVLHQCNDYVGGKKRKRRYTKRTRNNKRRRRTYKKLRYKK